MATGTSGNPSFHFWINDNMGSSVVRGHQMARALSGTCRFRSLEEADVTVFVKKTPTRELLDQARKYSPILLYDPVDNYDFDGMSGLDLDGVVACNRVHQRKLWSIFPDSVVRVIPHHCVEPREPSRGRRRVGYVGSPENLGITTAKLRKAFPDVLTGNGLGILDEISVGIAFRGHGMARAYKSGLKLANYWARGIAPVCSPDASHLEMGHDGIDMLLAFDDDHLVESVRYLMDNDDESERISRSGLVASRRYDVKAIARKYSGMVKELGPR